MAKRYTTETGGARSVPSPRSVALFTGDAGVRRVAGLVAGVFGRLRAVAPPEAHEQILLEDELLARVVGGGVDARVHADGVARAGFDAEAAEDAAELVDDEALREALVTPARIPFGVLAHFDVDALGRARRRAAEARDATGR